MKVRVASAINFLLTCNYCLCVHFLTSSDHDVLPESATFGISSRHDEFPFMTALGWWNKDSGEIDFLCGGMLISSEFVLTAAHCLFVEGRLPNVVKIGGNKLNSTYNEEHTVRNYFIHPWYDDTQAYNDVALLLLAKTSEKTPVCLWARQQLPMAKVTALGYGALQFAGPTTTILQKIDLTVISSKICRVYHARKRKFRFGISNAQLCAGDPTGRQDICQGDSGGPLIVRNDERQYAVGIISTGQACFGFPPAIYTRISSYITWISAVLNKYDNYFKICY